jgi:hypothetical protein
MPMDLESLVLGVAHGAGIACLAGGAVMAAWLVVAIVRSVRAERREHRS